MLILILAYFLPVCFLLALYGAMTDFQYEGRDVWEIVFWPWYFIKYMLRK